MNLKRRPVLALAAGALISTPTWACKPWSFPKPEDAHRSDAAVLLLRVRSTRDGRFAELNPEAPASWDHAGVIVEAELLEVIHGSAPADTRFLAAKPPTWTSGPPPERLICMEPVPQPGDRVLLYRRDLRWREVYMNADRGSGAAALSAWQQHRARSSP